MLKVTVAGQLMKAKKKDYDFDGNKGTSFKLDIYDGDAIQSVSVPADVYAEHKDCIGDDIELLCNCFAKSYNLKLVTDN